MLRGGGGAGQARRPARLSAVGGTSSTTAPTEFSYSSAPELMPVVLSQHTERLRFGHSGILAPFSHQPPGARRRTGRLPRHRERRSTRTRAGPIRRHGMGHLRGRSGDLAAINFAKRFHMIPKPCGRDEPFKWERPQFCSVPERNIVPKPMQKPHPRRCGRPAPVPRVLRDGGGDSVSARWRRPCSLPWRACATLFEPLPARARSAAEPCWRFREHDQRSVFTFVHCAETREQDAIDESGRGKRRCGS